MVGNPEDQDGEYQLHLTSEGTTKYTSQTKLENQKDINGDSNRSERPNLSSKVDNATSMQGSSGTETTFNRKSFSIDSLLFSAKQRHLQPTSLSSFNIETNSRIHN